MQLSAVRVSEGSFRRIQKDPSLLGSLFFDEDDAILEALGLTPSAFGELDYLLAYRALEMMAEEFGEEVEDDPVLPDLGPTGELDYGDATSFYLDPSAVKRALEESATIELDEEFRALFEEASRQGEFIIGAIS